MIARNAFIYILSKILPAAIGIVTTMILTWLLTPAAYGLYSLGIMMAMLTSSFFFDWLGLSMMRFFPRHHESDVFLSSVILIFIALCGISFLACALVSFSGLMPDHHGLIWVCLFGTWAYAWFEFAARMQIANLQPMHYFWMGLARNAGILVAAITAARLSGNPRVILAMAFPAMLIAGLLYLPREVRIKKDMLDLLLTRQIITYGWPISISLILAGLSVIATGPILDGLAGHEALGSFNVAFTLAYNTIAMIGTGAGSATYPLAVKAVDSGDRELARSQLSRNCALVYGLLLPAAIGIGMLAPLITHLLLSPHYFEPCIRLIPWLATAALLSGLQANYVDHGFYLGKGTRLQTLVMAVMAASNIGLNYLLIPHYGYLGAGLAMSATAAIGLALGLIAAQRCYPLPYPARTLAEITLASMVLATVLFGLRGHLGPLWLCTEIAAAGIAYGLTLVAFDTFGLRREALRWVASGRGAFRSI
jgi:O-antigen/teichoic acid export membrane protein